MKLFLLLFIACFTVNFAFTQIDSTDLQSSPEYVLEEVFRAARSQDFSQLSKFCPPDHSNDGDTQQYICDIAHSSEKVQHEFSSYFKSAKITGRASYHISPEGVKTATIPFWFNHPGGESRSNETMNFIQIDDRWYLYSF